MYYLKGCHLLIEFVPGSIAASCNQCIHIAASSGLLAPNYEIKVLQYKNRIAQVNSYFRRIHTLHAYLKAIFVIRSIINSENEKDL